MNQQLTVQDLGTPIPNVTATFAPVPVAPACSFWSELNGAIAGNPLIASVILAVGVFAIAGKGRRGR